MAQRSPRRDPFDGFANQPYSQHLYQYGYSQPTLFTDPSGLCIDDTGDGFGDTCGRTKPNPIDFFADTRPGTRERIFAQGSAIRSSAQRHNPPFSGLSHDQFAAIMVSIIMNEQQAAAPEIVLDILDCLQEFAVDVFDMEFSVGLVNFRLSVVGEIISATLPQNNEDGRPQVSTVPLAPIQGIDNGTIFIELAPWQMDSVYGPNLVEVPATTANEALSRIIADDALAIEFLATNLERGVYAMKQAGLLGISEERTVKSLAAWHNKGIVSPSLIDRNNEATSYAQSSWKYYTQGAHGVVQALATRP